MVADAAAISDNPRRDEGIDADWKAITTVVVVAIVADAALIMSARCDGAEHCDNYGDSGGNISYGDGDGRGGMVDLGRNEGDNAYYKEVMVLKDVAITAKVFTAIAVVAAEAMVPKTAGNSSDSAGDVFKATTVVAAVVITKDATRADYPGRDEGSDVVKKVMTAGVVVAMVADAVAKSDGAEDIGNHGDSGGQVSYGTGGGAALAMTQDENDGSEDFGNYGDSGCEAGEVTAVVGGSDDPGRDEGSDAALEAITAVDVVAIVAADAMVRKTPAIMATAAAKVLEATAVISDVTWETIGAMVLGAGDFGNYGDSGCEAGEVTAVVGGSDDQDATRAAMPP
ncbi:hypothetical protein Bbelb_021120 [Branchiostoma belcheri]|nr:hypothetical protein Bbelb_021120 [Branchiostoma belcheri]